MYIFKPLCPCLNNFSQRRPQCISDFIHRTFFFEILALKYETMYICTSVCTYRYPSDSTEIISNSMNFCVSYIIYICASPLGNICAFECCNIRSLVNTFRRKNIYCERPVFITYINFIYISLFNSTLY
jgi:hypothetical protein